MAMSCYAHNLHLNRSLQNRWCTSYKIIGLCNSWFLTKKELSSHSDNTREEHSSGKQRDDSQKEHVVSDVMTAEDENTNEVDSMPEEPTTCCMSGCVNCVWIEYAEELSKRYRDGGEKAREAIMKVSDPNMRAFLLTELRTKVT